MKTIGITGGAGAGKSLILSYIKAHCNCRILLADSVAHLVKEPGQSCYCPLVELLGETVLTPEGTIDKQKMADQIFGDEGKLKAVNAIIHPAVKRYILGEIDKERTRGQLDAFFVEAALLIEEGYDALLDELWYVYADENVRAKRLRESRGYSEEKIQSIFQSQLSREDFLRHCKVVIDNGESLSDTYRKIDEILKGANLYR